ncbi:MAG TPA: hypothetical protein VGO47_13920, partial [Chlamydiales bacterium]|nr:hypothetical protein [Chlamydiales bacterium]
GSLVVILVCLYLVVAVSSILSEVLYLLPLVMKCSLTNNKYLKFIAKKKRIRSYGYLLLPLSFWVFSADIL